MLVGSICLLLWCQYSYHETPCWEQSILALLSLWRFAVHHSTHSSPGGQGHAPQAGPPGKPWRAGGEFMMQESRQAGGNQKWWDSLPCWGLQTFPWPGGAIGDERCSSSHWNVLASLWWGCKNSNDWATSLKSELTGLYAFFRAHSSSLRCFWRQCKLTLSCLLFHVGFDWLAGY